MPRTAIVYFRERDGSIPMHEWLESLPASGRFRCVARLARLEALGHELRRPEADYLGNEIHELRAKHGRLHFRMLYFFHGRNVVVLTHGFTKGRARVPAAEIGRAIRRRLEFEASPLLHESEVVL